MKGLPVLLHVDVAVVVGGGAVATRKARSLHEAGATVRVVAPVVTDELRAHAAVVVERAYRHGDCRGADLVVVATDDPAANEAAARDARDAGALVNRADDGTLGDVTFMATLRGDDLVVGVATGGADPARAKAVRDRIRAAVAP